jgi:hypothetical protein
MFAWRERCQAPGETRIDLRDNPMLRVMGLR